MVGTVGDTRRHDHVVRVELAVLVHPATRLEDATGGTTPIARVTGVRLHRLDLDEVGLLRTVARLTSVAAAVLTAAVLALAVAVVLVPVLTLTAVLALAVAVVLIASVLALTAALVLALVVGPQGARRHGLQTLRLGRLAAFDECGDPLEDHRPLVLQRGEDLLLPVLGVLLDPLPELGEALVRRGDLGVQRGEFTVDVAALLLGHLFQFVADVRAVDGGDRLTGGLGSVGALTALTRRCVDVDRDQPTPAQNQGGRGGDRPVRQR